MSKVRAFRQTASLRTLGYTILLQTADTLAPSIELPEGYRYLRHPNEIDQDEANTLLQGAFHTAGADPYSIGRRDLDAFMADVETVDVAVTSPHDRLVGFGTLRYGGDQGILTDLVVHPDHRNRGIGKCLVSERVRIADGAGINHLRVTLMPTNNLRGHYVTLGFEDSKQQPDLYRGPSPQAPSPWQA